MKTRIPVMLLAILLEWLTIPAAFAAYNIDWHTVDGGGERSTGGSYMLQGTVAQPDANTPTLNNGGYQLQGGFWVAAAKLSPQPTDNTPPAIDVSSPKIANETAVDVSVKSNEDSNLYYVILPSDTTPPSAQQIKAGQNNDGNPVAADKKGILALTANSATTINLTESPDSTAHEMFMATEDLNGNITSVVKVDVSLAAALAPSLMDASPCPTSGLLNNPCNAGGQTIVDLTLQKTGHMSNGIVKNPLINHGWVSNLTITPQGTVEGGIVSGYIKNKGTMKNFEFRGGSIIGGRFEGTIVNNSEIGGYFQDVHLGPDTHIKGGRLKGKISGETPAAWLENVKIEPFSQLSGVILCNGVQLPEQVSLGAGVRFCKREDIPIGLDLTPLLPSIASVGEIDQPANIYLNDDVVVEGEGLLAAINALPEFADSNLTVFQNDRFGYLQLDIEEVRYAENPLTALQLPKPARLQIEKRDAVRFNTRIDIELFAQPAIQAPVALQATLAEWELPKIRVNRMGNLQVRSTETDDDIWYSARANFMSEVVENEAETGLFLRYLTAAFLVYTDDEGQKREQLFYPAPADMSALLQSARQVDLTTQGVLRFSLAGRTYDGLLDFLVIQGEATTTGIQVEQIADTNGDDVEDFLIIYPNGAQQMLWRLPERRLPTPRIDLEVFTPTAIQVPKALLTALAEQNLFISRVDYMGNLQVKGTETDQFWYSARPDTATEVVEDEAETGLFLRTPTAAFLVYTDEDGQKREQLFYPVPADMLALLQSAQQVDLTTAGVLRFNLNGTRYEGLLDYLVMQGEATNNGILVEEIADTNGDSLEDFLITYPNGAQQVLWRLAQSSKLTFGRRPR